MSFADIYEKIKQIRTRTLFFTEPLVGLGVTSHLLMGLKILVFSFGSHFLHSFIFLLKSQIFSLTNRVSAFRLLVLFLFERVFVGRQKQ